MTLQQDIETVREEFKNLVYSLDKHIFAVTHGLSSEGDRIWFEKVIPALDKCRGLLEGVQHETVDPRDTDGGM